MKRKKIVYENGRWVERYVHCGPGKATPPTMPSISGKKPSGKANS